MWKTKIRVNVIQLMWKTKTFFFIVIWYEENENLRIHGHKIILPFSSSAAVWRHLYKVGEREREREREREKGGEIKYVRVSSYHAFHASKQLIRTERPRRTMRCAAPIFRMRSVNSLTVFTYNSKTKLCIEFWQRKNCLRIVRNTSF